MASLQIFVADDDPRTRKAIAAIVEFQAGWQICGETGDGRKAVEQIVRLRPDIALIDLAITRGVEAMRQLIEQNPKQKVLLLVARDAELIACDAFRAGALGIIRKSSVPHDLVPAIDAVQRGRSHFTPDLATIVLKDCLRDSRSLSARQHEIIQLLGDEVSRGRKISSGRPSLAERAPKYLLFALLLIVASFSWWYVLSGEPDHVPPGVENLLVRMGFKTAPVAAPLGNPETQVWVDLRTGLYYCPGNPAFGKTSKGKKATQHEAQLDHFEPASGRACP